MKNSSQNEKFIPECQSDLRMMKKNIPEWPIEPRITKWALNHSKGFCPEWRNQPRMAKPVHSIKQNNENYYTNPLWQTHPRMTKSLQNNKSSPWLQIQPKIKNSSKDDKLCSEGQIECIYFDKPSQEWFSTEWLVQHRLLYSVQNDTISS